MNKLCFRIALVGGVMGAVPHALVAQQVGEDTVRAEMVKVARIELQIFEETKRARNEKLNQVFREYFQQQDQTTGKAFLQFNALLKEHDLTNFDDFLAAETAPLREVKDPPTGEVVPVLGPLGSDVINPWLAAVDVIEGKPLTEQPIYNLAADVLREHLDFALIGMKDPNLSWDLLPPKLRENGQWAYRCVNPTNQFNGGFDHPLFYVIVRLAAKKLFREDYPQAKPTMADIVVPEERGGFGLRGCLLCHDRNHTDVYTRILAQSLYHKARAAQLRENCGTYVDADGNVGIEDADEAKRADAQAAMFQRAAKTVLDAFPDVVDLRAARWTLAMLSGENLARLKPGYDEFCATLQKFGCLRCHSSNSDVPDKINPAKNGAFVLNPGGYFKTKNIKALSEVIDLHDLSNSRLFRKAVNEMKHKGAEQVSLDDNQAEELRQALTKWVYSVRQNPP